MRARILLSLPLAFLAIGLVAGVARGGSGSAVDLVPTGFWATEGNQASAYLGTSGTAGDVNGDGYADIVVAASSYDSGKTDEGRAYVYHGSVSGLGIIPDWTAESDQASAFFGVSVGTAGDVNGDGYADLVVGASSYSNDQVDEGRAFVYHGSVVGLSLTPNWTAESDQAFTPFGRSVATAGDVNGDGYDDVIVGAPSYDNGQVDEGRAFVYHGSAGGLSTTANWTAESDQDFAGYGLAVGSAGDVNGDGYDDVIVGAWTYDDGPSGEGWAFVYHGSASGLSTTANWTAEGGQENALFGSSVGTAGDVNGDGYADAIVGAWQYTDDQRGEGRAFVYQGSAGGLSTTANWTADGNQRNAHFGDAVGTAGDTNGDGYADVIVGATSYNHLQTDEGAAFVFHGSVTGLSTTADRRFDGDQVFPLFGGSVGTTGDVNADGYDDLIVGAGLMDHGETNEGVAKVYRGRS